MRQVLGHAFSDRAIREQKSIVELYIETLVDRRCREIQGTNEGKVNIVKWYNYMTFDVIGDLAFGDIVPVPRESEVSSGPYSRSHF